MVQLFSQPLFLPPHGSNFGQQAAIQTDSITPFINIKLAARPARLAPSAYPKTLLFFLYRIHQFKDYGSPQNDDS
jgi:hypothetical protein